MFLVKFFLGLVVVVLFIWFGANVDLGSRTLFEHLQAIGRTRETKDLFEGTRDKTKPLVEDVRRRLGAAADADDPKTTRHETDSRPTDEVSPTDREKLRKALGDRHPSR